MFSWNIIIYMLTINVRIIEHKIIVGIIYRLIVPNIGDGGITNYDKCLYQRYGSFFQNHIKKNKSEWL